jgi:hypothetical protein
LPEEKVPANADGYGYRVIGWLKEGIEESDAFLRSQQGYNRCDEAINAIMGEQQDMRSAALSSTSCNLIAKTFFDMVAGLTDVKPFWEYRSFNKRYEHQANIYGKLSEHVWLQRQMDMSFMFGIQYALSCGTTYLEPYWDSGVEDFKAEAWDPRDVLPIRPSTSPSIQDCYGVITRKARSVNHVRYLARHVFNRPDLANLIQPDRDGSVVGASLRNTKVGALLQRLGDSPFKQRLFGEKAQRDISRVPTTDIFTSYIDDDSINESSTPIHMGAFDKSGQPLNNWSHVVQPGDRLYPRKRMIVFVSGVMEPLYDGPSPWWHGMFPYPKLTLDPVPWSYLGKAPVWDLLTLNKSMNKLLRVYDDWCERLARPDVIADKSIPQHMIDRLDTRRAGKKIRASMLAGKGALQFVGPDNLPVDFWRGIEYYESKIKELSGSQDISSLMKLNQLPSSDSIESIMESMSLTWRLRSRVVEVFMREYALMMAYNFAQFYTLPRRLTILGGEGVTMQDFDFDPGSLVPDFVDSNDFDESGNVRAEVLDRGPLPRYERAREHLRQFSFHIAPGSLLAASEMQRKLLYLQLARAGMIDQTTLLETLGVPNINQIRTRMAEDSQLGIMMSESPAGRKASGGAPPQMKSKDGGTRTTITES